MEVRSAEVRHGGALQWQAGWHDEVGEDDEMNDAAPSIRSLLSASRTEGRGPVACVCAPGCCGAATHGSACARALVRSAYGQARAEDSTGERRSTTKVPRVRTPEDVTCDTWTVEIGCAHPRSRRCNIDIDARFYSNNPC
jgi:hypothetical protein